MEQISSNDKERLLQFIEENELDYKIEDGGIKKFNVIAVDGIRFFFYIVEGEYVIVKYDSGKDKDGQPGLTPYQYFKFKTLPQVLEQLNHYDESIPKEYWYPTANSTEIGFDKNGYIDDWYNDFKPDDEFSNVEQIDDYSYLAYSNPNYNPQIKSPFNTIHEVSPLNQLEDSYTEVNKLYFEIHPISCTKGDEKYLLKLLSNNEEVLKEYVNYIVTKKKGLKMLIDSIFDSVKIFKNK